MNHQELNNSENDKLTLLEKANQAVLENSKVARECPYRLHYHIMATSGWINDPNGLIQYKGEYHVFFQHYPYSPAWGPMHWGHVVSSDLVHWKHKPIALAPEESYEKGCFSGSAVDDNGILTLIYTAHDDTAVPKEVQCIATSLDGTVFTKHDHNPVINSFPKDGTDDFRDPKVWKYKDNWYLIAATGKDGIGKAVLYKSDDLREWAYIGVVCESDGTQGDIWECPDLFKLGDKDILITSLMHMKNGKNIFIIGDMNYETYKFTKFKSGEIDFGDDFYAAQTFEDDNGRRILIGWMDMWGSEFPTQKNAWAGALTIPRELEIKNGSLISKPIEELKKLRCNEKAYEAFFVNECGTNYLSALEGDSLEIEASIRLSGEGVTRFGFVLRESKDKKEKTILYYDHHNGELVIDKSMSGLGNKAVNKTKLNLIDGDTLNLSIFIDTSSIEVFANGGEIVMSNRIYPSNNTSKYYDIFSTGGMIEVQSLKAWSLKAIWD